MNANALLESDGTRREWVSAQAIRDLPIDQGRGTGAMAWFIVSEAMVFLALFFSYYYLGHGQPRWPIGDPPSLVLPTAMLFILLLSCIALWAGGGLLRQGRELTARGALLVTVLLGFGFLVLNALDYNSEARLQPVTQDPYTSIFYTINGVHAAHLILGLLFLLYAALLPRLGPTEQPPHGAYRNAAMYWYFVTVVWFVMYAIMYIGPHHVLAANPALH
ncbi:MAG TPA: cytochrome c oxidase subunit 3 [Steroidobacteraceae bacterium]|jgi:heme/copper-type cytochrome/quinol oxidase subunit 3|nr:cytochrome c oxidase subunit 3 [Steroidobacteraceae bacterium]